MYCVRVGLFAPLDISHWNLYEFWYLNIGILRYLNEVQILDSDSKMCSALNTGPQNTGVDSGMSRALSMSHFKHYAKDLCQNR